MNVWTNRQTKFMYIMWDSLRFTPITFGEVPSYLYRSSQLGKLHRMDGEHFSVTTTLHTPTSNRPP